MGDELGCAFWHRSPPCVFRAVYIYFHLDRQWRFFGAVYVFKAQNDAKMSPNRVILLRFLGWWFDFLFHFLLYILLLCSLSRFFSHFIFFLMLRTAVSRHYVVFSGRCFNLLVSFFLLILIFLVCSLFCCFFQQFFCFKFPWFSCGLFFVFFFFFSHGKNERTNERYAFAF